MPRAMREVGFLIAATPNAWAKYIGWFKAKLTTPNVNITLLPPGGAAGDSQKIEDAAKYLAKHVEVIVTAGTQAALACKAATQTNQTPFVFASVGDPAISGLTPQPGGNFTGGSNQQVKLAPLRVTEMLKPEHHFEEPFAVVGDYNTEPIKSAMHAAVTTLLARKVQAQLASITPGENINTFIDGLKNQGIKSLYVCSDMFITANSKLLNQQAHRKGMKTMFEFREHVDDHGGHLSYGVSFKELFEKAANCVDKILSGTKAGDLPIYEPPTTRHERAAKSRASPTKKRRASLTKKKSRRGA
jgi:ABC-type uncharacterized transport system substrate-binding protein